MLSIVIGNQNMENANDILHELRKIGFGKYQIKNSRISSLITTYYFDLEARWYLEDCNSNQYKKLLEYFSSINKKGIFLLAFKTAKLSQTFDVADYDLYEEILEYIDFVPSKNRYSGKFLEKLAGPINNENRGKKSKLRKDFDYSDDNFIPSKSSRSSMKVSEFLYIAKNYIIVNARKNTDDLEEFKRSMEKNVLVLADTFYKSGRKKKDISYNELIESVSQLVKEIL